MISPLIRRNNSRKSSSPDVNTCQGIAHSPSSPCKCGQKPSPIIHLTTANVLNVDEQITEMAVFGEPVTILLEELDGLSPQYLSRLLEERTDSYVSGSIYRELAARTGPLPAKKGSRVGLLTVLLAVFVFVILFKGSIFGL